MRFSAVPVTVLTGFLGSGKTTLVNRLLRESHGRRLAIIENEYGEVGVDAELIERPGNEAIIQLDNGCVCCTVRGDLANALARLADEKAAGRIAFDHVVIETSGLADPGPITRTFLAETAILEHFYLDGVVTLVDAFGAGRIIASRREARAQIAYADRIMVTKCDLVSEEVSRALVLRLRRMNRMAGILRSDLQPQGQEAIDVLLEIKGFQLDRGAVARIGDEACSAEEHVHCDGHHGHGDHGHDHLDDVTSVYWETDAPIDAQRFDAVMAAMADVYPATLWRIKGLLNILGARQRLVVQGVNGLLQINGTTYWRPFEPRRSRLVLIGEKLDPNAIRGMLDTTIA